MHGRLGMVCHVVSRISMGPRLRRSALYLEVDMLHASKLTRCLSTTTRVEVCDTKSSRTQFAKAVEEVEIDSPRKEAKGFNVTNLLADTMTPELEQKVLEFEGSKKYMLSRVLTELTAMQSRRKSPLPMPAELTVEQWRNLISLTDYRSRVYYLDALMNKTRDFAEIQALDDKYCNPLQISEEMISEALGDDQESRRKLKIFLMHHELMRQAGETVPFRVSINDLREIKSINSTNGYKRFIGFLLSKEFGRLGQLFRKRAVEVKSQIRVQETREMIENEEHIYYGLGQNSIFLRTNDRTMENFYNWKTVREFNSWGVPLVIDLSYFDEIKSRTAKKSLMFREVVNAIRYNRMAKTPFQLHFAGMSPKAKELMEVQLPHCQNADAPFQISQESQTELFPTERLVYLSPDSKNDLKSFSHDDIYVIGGIVDKTSDRMPLTLSAAKRLKIRHARFPMRRHIGFVAELNVDTCVAILNDMKETQDWFYSLRWVPSRYFAARIKSGSRHLDHMLTYQAHRALSPTTGISELMETINRNLDPRTYRDFYKKLMEIRSKDEVSEILRELQELRVPTPTNDK